MTGSVCAALAVPLWWGASEIGFTLSVGILRTSLICIWTVFEVVGVFCFFLRIKIILRFLQYLGK